MLRRTLFRSGFRLGLPALAALALGGISRPARADDDDDDDDDDDHDHHGHDDHAKEHKDHDQGGDDNHARARRAMEAGEIRPLADLLTIVEQHYVGRVVDTDLDRDDGRWIYTFKILPPTGQMYRLELDAKTGVVIKTKGRVQTR